ncbi:glucokinase [Pseudomonas sp. 5P_3.1_Bac2]|uniref:glucokinase n=1 Tax=Pseudomonas sp. 5P_3.1_Bac2 TaxID=2971617 RepID=UPI0021C74FAB|nr:glucokinase [Pseudomonas sp. 5P_3.1_Bac2]MCU1717225.1 glucokinase [Pseudomonas sp. 5P_3.1_Bac2]
MKLALVGDIGGTNARLALWRDGELSAVQVLATAAYASLELAVAEYLAQQQVPVADIEAVCLAVAGPVRGEEFRFTNNHWRLNRRDFCNSLGIAQLLLINDFTAMALGMTRVTPEQRIEVCSGVAEVDSPAVVIGPGTGLGVGTLLALADGSWHALPGEGGHVDLPVASPAEAQLWLQLQRQLGHVRAEDVLSGNGLLQLYQAYCALHELPAPLTSPAAITEAALAEEPVAQQVLEQFCVWLGRVAGNNVLTLGARGGVYIVGGVVPRFAEFFRRSGFAQALRDKGVMSRYFAGLPVYLVTAPYPGLEGAGVALQQLR